jgi:hypothetical protein
METEFNFYDYYKPNFVDPLYAPYMTSRPLNPNPWTMNPNEIRYAQGYDFKKQFSHWGCPVGFTKKGYDYCTRKIDQIPLFYMRDSPTNFFWCSKIGKSVYPS